MDKKYNINDFLTADDIKRIRNLLHLTQKDFASLIGVSKPTVERWEMGNDHITGPIVLLLQLIESDKSLIEALEIKEKELPLRFYYMHDDDLCSIIDVDDINKVVKVTNYNNYPIYRAFGVNDNPTYQDYLDFLESRCFPRERDKMKLILEELDLPFYDPFLIIKKTEGRMAEDRFWLKIED